MARKTSVEAYEAIKRSGRLSKLRWNVYDYLYHNGPCTAKDVIVNLGRVVSGNASSDSSYNARLSELRRMGLVYEAGETVSGYSKQPMILWDVTDAREVLPLPKKLSEKAKVIAQLDDLRREVRKAMKSLDRREIEPGLFRRERRCDIWEKRRCRVLEMCG